MNKKTLNTIVSFLCVALIALSIYFNPGVIRSLSYEELTADAPPSFTGIINVWQISSWRVAQSSKTLVLLDVAKQFEKSNPSLYIEVVNISYEDYIRKTSQGIYPDVLSFPAEMKINYSMCTAIPINNNLEGVFSNAYLRSGTKAIPWLATSNVVLVNSKQATKKSIVIDRYQSHIQIASTIDTLLKGDEASYGSLYAMLPLCLSDAKCTTMPHAISPYKAWSAFATKESSILYGCIWQTYAMDRLIAREKGFTTEYIYPHVDSDIFYWTQNFCVLSNDLKKNNLIFDYISLVLSDNWQIKIADATASFPTTKVEMQYDGVRREIAKSSQRKMAIIPGIGIDEAEIIKALSGDVMDKALLKEKLVFN